MQVRNTLRAHIKSAVSQLQQSGVLPDSFIGDFKIGTPTQAHHGDYSSTIALQIGASSGKKPKRLAHFLAAKLQSDESLKKFIARIDVIAPGFINFHLAPEFLAKQLFEIISQPGFNMPNVGGGKKLNLEFVSINPTGPLHIGHGRIVFYGDVLANILSYAGYKVTREYYVNNSRQSAQIKELGKTVLGQGTSYKGPYLDKKIRQNAGHLKRLKSFGAAGNFIAGKIQKDIKELLAKAGVNFDVWFEEETLYKNGEVDAVLKALAQKGLVYEADGAQWLKTTRFADTQDQVIIRSSGEHTYFLADITYHLNKSKRSYVKLIDIWGADHQGHVQRMQAAMRALKIKNLDILITQLVRLKGGAKLSKRAGNIITLQDLLEVIGPDASRFFYLTKSLDSQMEFDVELAALKNQKNPVFYIQYTHARICSIVHKAHALGHFHALNKKHLHHLQGKNEQDLMRKLVHFNEVIEDSARDYQVQRLTTYLLELAQIFNQFYRDHHVLVDEIMVRDARLTLTIATGMIMRECLALLGIEAPERL